MNKNRILVILLVTGGAALWFASGSFFGVGGEKELTLEEARATPNPVPESSAALAEAKALFTEHCAHCHGDEGDGHGGEAQMYTPPPADFTRPGMASIRDGELFYRISEGRKPMPSFRRLLRSEQRWKLVRYLRTFASPPPAPEPK